jgi:biotin transport system substrate-specific component
MTMQTLVVLFLGITLGWKLGVTTVALYLFEGIIGLPVFSGSPEKGVGIVYFTGPTMGYLVGFLFTVYFAGKFHYNTIDLTSLLKNYTVVNKFYLYFWNFMVRNFNRLGKTFFHQPFIPIRCTTIFISRTF